MTEWPLVLFTVVLQLSCGVALAATFSEYRAGPRLAVRPLGIAIFPLAAIGTLASLFHLSHPFSAYLAVRKLGSSPLSLEVFFTLLFALAALAYSYFWWKDKNKGRRFLGVVTSVLGVAAVVSSSTIYLVPTQPAWNSGWLPVSFLGTTLLLGGFLSAALTGGRDQQRLLRSFLAAGIAGSLMVFASAMWMLANLSRVAGGDYAAARLQYARVLLGRFGYSGWFGLYVLLTAVVPVALAFRFWPGGRDFGRQAPAPLSLVVGFVAVLVGALIGRTIMYLLGTSAPPF